MTTVPFGSWMAEQTANCEAPPPDGSTATRMLLVFSWYSKSMWREMSPMRGRLKKASTRCEGKALCVPSDARPMLSRSNIAGSSARMPFTISILFDDSHLGISANLCVHFSGSSVFRQAAHTSEICMLAKSGRPSESERLNILE